MPFYAKIAFPEIAAGNEDATSFLHVFYEWVQTQDDLMDRDKPVPPREFVITNMRLMFTLTYNEFFLTYREKLLPVILASSVAYVDSERFRTHESVLDRVASQVLKSQYADVFYMVAFIVGGIHHMIAMAEKYREFSYDPCPPPAMPVPESAGVASAVSPLPA